MTPEDETRFRLIIREELQSVMAGYVAASTANPLCGDPTFQQRSAALDEQRRLKEAKLASKSAKRKKRQEAA